jgi:CHAT domain-containing protein
MNNRFEAIIPLGSSIRRVFVAALATSIFIFNSANVARSDAGDDLLAVIAGKTVKSNPLLQLFLDGDLPTFYTEERWDKMQQLDASLKAQFSEVPGTDAIFKTVANSTLAVVLDQVAGAPKADFEKFMSEARRNLKKSDSSQADFEMFSGRSGNRSARLASIYGIRGYDTEAREIFEGEVHRLASKSGSESLAGVEDEYGIYLLSVGDAEGAEKLLNKSLEIRRKLQSSAQTRSLLLLAGLEASRENKTASDAALESAFSSVLKGKVDKSRVSPLAALGGGGDVRLRYNDALNLVIHMGWQLQAMGKYAEAERVMDVLLAAAGRWFSHDDLRFTQEEILAAVPAFAAGHKEKALRLIRDADDEVARIFLKMSWSSGYDKIAMLTATHQNSEMATIGASLDVADLLEQELLVQKSFAFRQSLEKRRLLRSLPESAPALDVEKQLVGSRTQYRDLVLTNHDGDVSRSSDAQVEAADLKLAEALTRPEKTESPVSLARLGAALPKNAAYVDFIVRNRWSEKANAVTEWCAVVIQAGREPIIARCGESKIVRQQIDRYREVVLTEESGPRQDAAVESASRELYANLIAPVEKVLAPGIDMVFVCPDGPLGFIGLGSLLDESGHFWCERHDVRFVSDGQAVMTHSSGPPASKFAAFVGDPDYADAKPATGLVAKSARPDYLGMNLPPSVMKMLPARKAPSKNGEQLSLPSLPGTREEVSQLRESFTAAGWKATTLLGKEATEERVKALDHPAILHLATHGFFLSEIPSDGSTLPLAFAGRSEPTTGPGRHDVLATKGIMEAGKVSPMLLSQIALTGAQTTLRMWCKGQYPKSAADGVLMADEVMDLDFSKTLLVTLSACESGLGQSLRGEGSVGMQRALLVGGARNVLATLWPIADKETVEFIQAFYLRVIAGDKPAAALSMVQKDFLLRRRKARGLAAAVKLTAPFVLTSSEQ